MRLYVTAPEGRRIAGMGSRQPGEFFDLPDDVVQNLLEQGGFSITPLSPGPFPHEAGREEEARLVGDIAMTIDEAPADITISFEASVDDVVKGVKPLGKSKSARSIRHDEEG